MILELNGELLVSLELGQIYLVGKQTDGVEIKSKNFIELDNEESLSGKHCIIETNHNEEAFVFDLFSSKGTLLNNNILKCMIKTLLKHGDILKIGNKEIKYIHQGHEMSCDSSGFLEVQKNASDIIASSPESTSQVQNRLKLPDDHKFLMPIRPSTSFTSRRSDSFTIPETQYCKPRSSLNESKLSIAESIPDKSMEKIKFNFGNQDSFGDDLCIPETQELATLEGIDSSQKPRLLSDIKRNAKQTCDLNEASMLENKDDDSQFRINTQDYNEGFGEEETALSILSQIIPIIKHSPVIINKTIECSNSINKGGLGRSEKEISSLKWSNSNINQETTELRVSCITPDIFEFEAMNNKEVKENADISPTQQSNVPDEDDEDLMPTQRLPPVLKKVEKKNISNEVETPCLEKEAEEILTLSDKENRCPAKAVTITDMPTQIFDAKPHTSIANINSISSDIKVNNLQENKMSSHYILNIDTDEEDDLLTQAFLQPKSVSVGFSSSSSKNLSNKCFNSTLLDDKCTEKAPATLFAEIEKNQFKQVPNVFKKPDADLSVLRKTASASSTVSENDIDLLMCTPQLIRDNLSLGRSDDLKKNILAVKNRNLFGDDTEDEDDEQNNLVKLINVPKSSLDFDQLLVHLNQQQEDSKQQDEQSEAQKIYKFNISFGKELDEKQSKSTTAKPSSYSRDERHAARDKEKEIAERKGKTKANQDKYKALSKHQEKMLDKKLENKEKQKANDEKNKKRREKKKESDEKEKDRKLNEGKRDLKTTNANHNDQTEEIQMNEQVQVSVNTKRREETGNRPESTARLRKGKTSDKSENREPQSGNEQPPMPAKRLTRAKSRVEETASLSNVDGIDNMDSISTQPIVKKTRFRSKPYQNDSQESTTSNTSTKTNESKRNTRKIEQTPSPNLEIAAKKPERKRKAEASTAVMPAKIDRKRLKNAHSEESLTPPLPSITISITNVDHELIMNLFKNAKGAWNIATNAADCDILVMDKPLRTFKFLLSMARGIPIVTSEYLKKLNKSKSVKEVNLKDYYFSDREFEKKYKFSLVKSQQAVKKQQIFKDHEFLMTDSILPIPQEIKAIIEASGGYVHSKTPPQPKENQKLYLVTTKEDKKDWHKYRRLNKNIIIVSTEAIMSAIMSQSCERMKSFVLA